jgi:hypothetical protein
LSVYIQRNHTFRPFVSGLSLFRATRAASLSFEGCYLAAFLLKPLDLSIIDAVFIRLIPFDLQMIQRFFAFFTTIAVLKREKAVNSDHSFLI